MQRLLDERPNMLLSLIYGWVRKQLPLFLFGLVVLAAFTYTYNKGVQAGRANVDRQMEELVAAYNKQMEINAVKAAEMGILAGSRLAEVQRTNTAVSTELKSHFKAQEQKHAERKTTDQAEGEAVCADPLAHTVRLDHRTVGLLNAARENRSPEDSGASAGADEEGGTSAVTVADLALNDIEVVRKYHELATRHDGLVDWVLQQCVEPTQKTNAHEPE